MRKIDPYQVPLSDYGIKAVSQYYPYVPSKQELPIVPLLLAQTDDDDLEEEESGGGGEFCFGSTFAPDFVDECIWFGYFPMALRITDDIFVIGIKSHNHRCYMNLDNLHISKSTKRRAKDYTFSINSDYNTVLSMCHARYGENWLCAPLRKAFVNIHENPTNFKAKLHSIELRDKDGTIVACELGYSLGSIYTSQTGTYNKAFSGAGSVQLAVLGQLLKSCGFKIWDFGMAMKYKNDLGGVEMPRLEWLRTVTDHRQDPCELKLEHQNQNAQALLRGDAPKPVVQEQGTKTKGNSSESQSKKKQKKAQPPSQPPAQQDEKVTETDKQ